MKDWWSEVEYKVIHQVANGVPSYEIKNPSSNLKVVHHNQLFLLATPRCEVTSLCEGEDADSSVSTRSVLAELTHWSVKMICQRISRRGA